jgi:7-carboxy-7-deazaguanine synthase
MLVSEVVDLTQRLKERGHFITIETAGTVWLPVACDLMSISPKRANSTPIGTDWEQRHDERRHRPDVIRRLIATYGHQLKFVIDTPPDVEDVADWLREFPEVDPRNVMLMPQGTQADVLAAKQPWIEAEAARRGWSMSPRQHIELFGNTRGT